VKYSRAAINRTKIVYLEYIKQINRKINMKKRNGKVVFRGCLPILIFKCVYNIISKIGNYSFIFLAL